MKRYWVWLQCAAGVGSGHINTLLEYFKNITEVYNAGTRALQSCGIPPGLALRLSDKSFAEADKIINQCAENSISIITYEDTCYPRYLKEISDPPCVLYAVGNIEVLRSDVMFCIVGPRKVSEFGKRASFSLAARLCLGGMTVVSGGAIGCDSAAHKGALAVSGKTVAVLASGLLDNYLKSNSELRSRIAENNVLISECPPYMPLTKNAFRIRNRILSGMTLGTAVIEASEKSGALLTANFAAEQGRDVFVIPGNPTDLHYKGSNGLLRDGAHTLLEANDIFFTYIPRLPGIIDPERAYAHKLKIKHDQQDTENISKDNAENKKPEKIKKNVPEYLSNNAKIVYNQLDKPEFYPDDINRYGMSGAELIAALSELEIYGYIKSVPGGRYCLK